MMMIIIIQLFYLPAVGKQVVGKTSLGKTSVEKKRFFSGIARMRGGSTHARIFGPLFFTN